MIKTVDPLDTRGLPGNTDAERFILHAIFHGDLDYRDCRASLAPEDFMLQYHQVIFRHMGVLCDGSFSVDSATMAESLNRAGELQGAGGISYLIDLDINIPSFTHTEDYIRIVRDKSILRRVILMADTIRNDAIMERGDASELLGRAERMVTELGVESASMSEFRQPGEIIRNKGGLDSYLNRGKDAGVPTGFPKLDDMTCGIRPGHLWVLGADTGGGKSTFARQIGLNAAFDGYPGALVTLEMAEDEITDGLICTAGEINSQIIRRGLNFERDKIREAAVSIADLPFYIRDSGCATIPKIHGELRKLRAEKGIKWAIVDYLQLMTPSGRFGSRAEEVGSLSRGLKLIAQDLKIGIIALSQVTTQRKAQGKTVRPELTDLRESGSVEQDSNLVMFLFTEWQASPMVEYPCELLIKKQRGGELGTIHMLWRKSTGSFREMDGGNGQE